MKIYELATHLEELEEEISDLEINMFADKKELEKKEKEKKNILNELIFYDDFEELYELNKKHEFDSKLLYPFKEIINEQGEKEFVTKYSEEYRNDVLKYIEQITQAYKDGEIDKKTFEQLKEDASKLYQKQAEKIEKEEKEKEKEIDIQQEYENIVDSVEKTKKAFIYNEIGEESYQSLQFKYKNMQEVDRKILLTKTHEGLCKEMGMSCDLSFTKYDIKDNQTVSKDGYCIKEKDLNEIPYPLDVILLEQSFKLHIKKILNMPEYTLYQKEQLNKLLYQSLEQQKRIVLENFKKKELKYDES